MACVSAISSIVRPSGFERATMSVPIVAEAPGRLSTTTAFGHMAPSFWPKMRASTSVPPPGAKGTTMRSGRLG